MNRDSKELIAFRNKWRGKRVQYYGDKNGRVDDVCDDGHRCDHDLRRKYKPTGQLIVIRDDGETDYPLYWQCTITREEAPGVRDGIVTDPLKYIRSIDPSF